MNGEQAVPLTDPQQASRHSAATANTSPTDSQLARRAAYLEALNAIIAAAVASSDLEDLLETALAHTLQAMRAGIGAIWVGQRYVLRGASSELIPALAQAINTADVQDALETYHTLVVEDWIDLANSRQWPHVDWSLLGRLGVRAFLAVPISVDGHRIGGLSIAFPAPRHWTEDEVALIKSVGRQLGTTAERMRLLEEARAHATRMAQLAAVGETLNRLMDPERLVVAIGKGALQLSRATRAALYGRKPDDAAVCLWSHRLSAEYIAQVLDQMAAMPGGQLLQDSRRPVLVEDVQQLPADALLRRLADEAGFRAVALWPLAFEGRTVAGLACYYDAPRAWPADEQEIMATFARQAAVALENARLYQSLQNALRAKDEMLQMVSHELRTPLAIIVGYVDMLLEGLIGPLTAEQRGIMETLASQGSQLDLMIKRLLMLQTLGEQDLVCLAFDPGLLLTQIVQSWQGRARDAGIRLHLQVEETLPTISADVDLLRHALDNLVDNAIKFSPEGGLVTLRIWSEAGQVLIEVADEGIGIPADELTQLFQSFYQVDRGMTRRFPGMGIGLALSRAIVESHGGRVWAESSGPRQGSTFYMALPVGQESSKEVGA